MTESLTNSICQQQEIAEQTGMYDSYITDSDLSDYYYDAMSEVYDKYAYFTETFEQKQCRKKKVSKGKVVAKQRNKSKMKQLILNRNVDNPKLERKNLTEDIARYTPRVKRLQLSKEFEKLALIFENLEKRRENAEKVLQKKGWKRQSPNSKPIKNNNIDAHVLTSLQNSSNTFKDDTVSQFLIDLQFRDISPDDYEYLLQLDDSVQNKVASNGSIANLPAPSYIETDSMCVICFDPIIDRFGALILPKCKHIFHKDCIKTWLGEISDKCPIDNIMV